MTNDDEFFEQIRGEAKRLRFEGRPGAHERIRTGVRSRIDKRESAASLLLGWFRPVIAAVAATLAMAAALAWMQQPAAGDLMASSDVAPLSEDYYRVAD